MTVDTFSLTGSYPLSGRPTWQALVAAGTVYGSYLTRKWINEEVAPTMTGPDVVALAQAGTPTQLPLTVEWMRQWADAYGVRGAVVPIPRPQFAGPSCHISVERLLPLWRTGADPAWLALIVRTNMDAEFLSGDLVDTPENRQSLIGLAALLGNA